MIYDLIVIGAGPAGVLAAMEIATKSNLTVAILEKARRLNDARNIGQTWFGGSARSAVKLFADVDFGGSYVKSSADYDRVMSRLQPFYEGKVKTKPAVKLIKKAQKIFDGAGIELITPKTCQLSEDGFITATEAIYNVLKKNINIIHKVNVCGIESVTDDKGSYFVIKTDDFTYKAKMVLLSTGRSGQAWFAGLEKNFEITSQADSFDLGLRFEFPASVLEKVIGKDIDVGLKWDNFRTTIPIKKVAIETEEAGDLKIANARQCSGGRRSIISFSLMQRFKHDRPVYELNRLSALANVLADSQLIREPVSRILTGKSALSPITQYASFVPAIRKLADIFPGMVEKGLVYAPESRINVLKYQIEQNGQTGVSRLYMAGDIGGHSSSFIQASVSGLNAAEQILKDTGKWKEEEHEHRENSDSSSSEEDVNTTV